LNLSNHDNYNCTVTTDTGQEYQVFADWLHNENLDYWKDWHCEVGITRVYLHSTGEVFDGQCKNMLLGHIDGEWSLKQDDQAVCNKVRCVGCTDDLLTTKFQGNI